MGVGVHVPGANDERWLAIYNYYCLNGVCFVSIISIELILATVCVCARASELSIYIVIRDGDVIVMCVHARRFDVSQSTHGHVCSCDS